MMKKVFSIVILVFLSSCVSKKNMEYLQKDTDELVTEYNVQNYSPYRIQTFDVLNVTIQSTDSDLARLFSNTPSSSAQNFNKEQLYFMGYTVDDHGNIELPLLGKINVLGYTIEETKNTITKKLTEDYFKKEANLFVTVKLAGFRYTLNGEVNAPGTHVLYQDRVSILEAIANAGDITMVGNRKEVLIIRKLPAGVQTFTVDLTDHKLLESTNYYIQPNDYIYVKPLPQKSWGTGTTGIQTLGTIITGLSLITTTILLLRNL